MTRFSGVYPDDWKAIAHAVKTEAGWKCVRCKHAHNPSVGRTLTVHHLDGCKANSAWFNLLALCQSCHLRIQARVNLDRPWVMMQHSEWFRVFAAGFYACKYLGLELTREETEIRLDELLQLERRYVLGVTL
jgi:hypothetical protein